MTVREPRITELRSPFGYWWIKRERGNSLQCDNYLGTRESLEGSLLRVSQYDDDGYSEIIFNIAHPSVNCVWFDEGTKNGEL